MHSRTCEHTHSHVRTSYTHVGTCLGYRNRGPAESTLEEKPESASGDERTCSPSTLSRARFFPEAQTGKEQMGQDMLEEGHVDGARERGGEVMDDAVNLVSSGQGGVKEEADLDPNSPGSSLPEYVHAQTKQPAPGKVAVHFARDLISKFEAQSQGQNQHRMGEARAVQGKQKTSVAERWKTSSHVHHDPFESLLSR